MDRGSSSFSQRLRALTSRPEGEAETSAATPADGQQPVAPAAAPAQPPAPVDEQPTTEWAATQPAADPAAPVDVTPGPSDAVAPPPPRAESPAPPQTPVPQPADDAETIEWRAIRLPEADGPTLDPPKLQKPSKTPRPAAATPQPTAPAPEQPPAAPAPAGQQPPVPSTPAVEQPPVAPAPAPEFAKPEAVADPPTAQPTAVWGAVTPDPAPEIPAGDQPARRASLWGRIRPRESDPDIVSVDHTRPAAASTSSPDARSETDETSSLTAALRRFKPTKPAAEEPAPAAQPVAPAAQPAAAAAASGQQSAPAFTPEPVPDKPSFSERATLRRRAKSLRARRDSGLLELGAIILDQRRFGDASGGTLARKRTDELADIDNELADIEVALGEDKPMTALQELGIERCSSCAALVGPRDRFCAQCGTARGAAPGHQPAS